MGTTTTAATPSRIVRQFPVRNVSLRGAVRSEWIKFRGLASNNVLAGFTFLLLVANGIAMPWAYVFRDRGSAQANYDAYPEMIVDKTGYVGIVLAVLAVLMVTNEYRSGQISTTLLSVPRRTPALIAKAAIIASVAFVIGVVSSAIGFAVAPPILAGGGYSYVLETPDLLRLVVGSGFYLAAISVIGIALGAIIRNVIAAVLATIVFLIIVPVIPQMFSEYGTEIMRFFPIQAGSLLLAPAGTDPMGPWGGSAVLLLWTLALFVSAAVVLKRRDA
ncbi:ABC transporter permease [Pseudoclavibacter sp. VKM Ac-2867]|uniref:ABC transporter permease n=1 Tax=Pseudoclavibacter sp. VKM Ac-2867 TaxID=2783829 RepID=UPI00188C5A32|nr:ABC transporter permease [Pseudoclavibacter sp. VKM Ac-2867]MBF4459191.1 ABC transporter permease [Pseudoclavibacter sp. VKM Ac-2867]